MKEFLPLGKTVKKIEKYLSKSKVSFCDISLGAKYLWRDEFNIEYAIVNDTLILKESCRDYKDAFYYPMGEDEESALQSIEDYTRSKHIPLIYCCLDKEREETLKNRYEFTETFFDRKWSDYIYTAEQFKGYSGKKMSGQRNYVNRFNKNYPVNIFKIMTKDDISEVLEFISDFERGRDFSLWTEKAEHLKLADYIENMFSINQVGGILKVADKVIGVAIGEIIGDTLIVHVEKALKSYEGAYPMLASEFAKAFCNKDVKYINREEDCGDEGLRKSKTQYHPIEVKDKLILKVDTLISYIPETAVINTERLTITAIKESDKENYYKLYMDDENNKYWGYDYREELDGATPSPKYFYAFQEKMKKTKEEFSFAVRLDGEMIGELVFHNFDYNRGLEIGYRFLKEHQKKGYAFESASALINYAKNHLKAKTVYTRCDKRNIPSHNLITKLGFKIYKESDTHYFFKQN